MKLKLAFSIILFLVTSLNSWSLDIKVNLQNGTSNSPAKVKVVNLLQLAGRMNLLKKKVNVNKSVTFKKLPVAQDGPYMVQAEHQGVLYSKVIPPLNKGFVEINLPVYDVTNKFSSTLIKYRVLYNIKYTENFLNILVLYHFQNTSKHSFTEKEKGIYVYVPEQAENVEGSVSVGSGQSNIQWLRLTPTRSKVIKKTYLLSHTVKPGSKVFQLQYKIPYQNAVNIPFKDYYARDIPVQLFIEPNDISLSILERPKWKISAKAVNGIDKKVIELPDNLKNFTLQLKGGTPLSIPARSDQQAVTISLVSPLNIWIKFGIGIIIIMLFWMGYFYITQKPLWLQNLRIKEVAKLKHRLEVLQSLDWPENKKKALVEKLEKRILKIHEYLK